MFHFIQLVLFVVVFFLNFHLLPVTSELSDDGNYGCRLSFKRCPNGEIIRYPFFLEEDFNDKSYCGYPGLAAKCSKGVGRPFITLSNHSYYYQHAHGDPMVRLIDVDTANQICPQPRHNFSLEGPIASFLSMFGNVNATFFYNCTILPKHVLPNLPCLDNNYNNASVRSFAMLDKDIPVRFNWYANCQDKVTIPLDDYFTELNYPESIQFGIWLQMQPSENCRICEDSGGNCSYNRNSTSFQCYCYSKGVFNKRCPTQGKFSYVKITITVGLSMGIVGLLLIIVLFIYRQRSINITPTNVEVFLQSYESHVLQRYKYSDIKKITNSFKDTLGKGGFGSVFKGKLIDGRMVAVKILNESNGDGEEFINEVATIGRTNHVNIVTLIGFCIERKKRALVYEYMINGSLDKFIYKEKSPTTIYAPALGLEKIHQIALGIARGLEYLHRGCNNRILHFDIKPHNILLDSEFVPKISDFGLAKLSQTRDSVVSMIGTRGTRGYIAPEISCRHFGVVSYKSDVYSYGMMLFEMIGGRKNIDATVENISEIYFPHWIYNHLNGKNKIEGFEDSKIDISNDILQDGIARKMMIIALWCIQAHPNDRPSMKEVAEMLEETNDKLQMPPDPLIHPSSKLSPPLPQ